MFESSGWRLHRIAIARLIRIARIIRSNEIKYRQDNPFIITEPLKRNDIIEVQSKEPAAAILAQQPRSIG